MNNNNYFSSDIIDQVINESDIIDVVSQYVTLRKMGTSLKSCCPFHTEKTPSFVVSREKQLYHCFGCGAGGNVVTFIMEIEKLNFVEALKLLAERAKINLPQNDKYDHVFNQKKDRQLMLHSDAAIFYYRTLLREEHAKEYLQKRNIEKDTIKKFGIGYAPNNGNCLVKYLLYKKYSIDELLESGLVLKNKNGSSDYYDRFRDRIIFPIQTVTDKVIAFGGRVLDNNKFPKYLNSPETKIFTKGKNLYGLNNAKKEITDNQIIIVEGYMDVIGLFQKGIKNAVASLGTAFTPDQGKLIKRYTNEVIVVYDGDQAGQEAASKAIEILEKCGLNAKVTILPEELDPDEYINKYGNQAFYDRKDEALVVVEYKISKLKQKYNTNSIDGRINFAKDISKYLSQLNSSIELEAYLNKISKDIGLSKESIIQEIKKNQVKEHKNTDNGNYRKENQQKIIKSAAAIAQEKILSILVNNQKLYPIIQSKVAPEDFYIGLYRDLANYLFKKLKNKENIEESKFITSITNSEDVKIASSIFTLDESIEEEHDINSYINTLKKFKLQNHIRELQEQMLNQEIDEEKNKIYYKIIESKRELENL